MIGSASSEIVLNKLKILKLVACGEHCLLEGEHFSQNSSSQEEITVQSLI